MNMTLHDKKKQELRKKIGKHIRRISIIVLKPFLPFIIVIVLIIFAVSTVSDVLFGSEDDAHVIEELSSEDYEAQYEKWLEETNAYGTVLADSRGLIPNGMFIWPTPGYTTITSHFGMRVHPISGLYKFHTGVDVAAPEGAEFVAMADGTVSIAKYSSSYGNLVMIDHRQWHCYFICTWQSNISSRKSSCNTGNSSNDSRLNRKFNRATCTF